MTNQQIIAIEQVKLYENGILTFNEDTQDIQQIHTYNGWKARGYQVKKGSIAVAKFPIWKFVVKPNKEASEEEESEGTGRMIMKTSAFFTEDQVERVEK